MQKGLDLLLTKYSVGEDAVISEDGRSATVGNTSYPIHAWECERCISELRVMHDSGRLGAVCTYRIGHTTRRGADLWALLYRELGILSFTMNSGITEIFAIAADAAMNCIVTSDNGCIATIELAATLGEGEEDVDKHEMICREGVACDRVIDTQVPQHSIYLFGKEKAKFKDVDAELYGLSEGEVSTVRCAFKLASSECYRTESIEKARMLESAVKAAKTSIETLENVKVG